MKPNLPQRARRWLRWFFASGMRLIALCLLAIGRPGVIPGPFGGLFPSELVRFHTAISAELVGMALAVLLIDTANELRSEHERKDELILQMGSDNNVLVKEAVRILRLKGWIEDGTLRGANLMHAKLQGAHHRDADLQ